MCINSLFQIEADDKLEYSDEEMDERSNGGDLSEVHEMRLVPSDPTVCILNQFEIHFYIIYRLAYLRVKFGHY